MSDPFYPRTDAGRTLAAAPMNWGWMLAMGVLFIFGGVIALVFPVIASLTVEAFIAAIFLLGGLMQLWLAVRGEEGSTGARLVAGALGVLMILFAVSLWVQPLAGLLSLTIVVASFLLAMGAVRIWLAFRMRHRRAWGWLFASGVLSVLLSILIFLSLPVSALSILGIFFGIELLVAGAAAIALALEARKSG